MAVGRKTGGRKAGTPNKLTKAVKEMVIEALDEAHEDGGVAYLKQQAKDNPTAFLSLVGKVLPLQLQGDPNNPLMLKIQEIRRTRVSP